MSLIDNGELSPMEDIRIDELRREDEQLGRNGSPYAGTFSFQNYPERDVSLTTTLFLGLRQLQAWAGYFERRPHTHLSMSFRLSILT